MSVHFSHSVVSKFCDPMHWITPGFSVHYKLPKLESVMTSNHLILCHPLLLLPSIFPSIRVFCNESVLRIRWPKYWSFSFSISPSNEYSQLISFRIDLFCSPRDSQESSPIPWFKSINSLALNFLYGPTLTSIHDYWKNHSFDYTDLCWQSKKSVNSLDKQWIFSWVLQFKKPKKIFEG